MRKRRLDLMGRLVRNNGALFSGALACTAATVLLGFLTPVLVAEVLDHYLGNEASRLPAYIGRLALEAGGREYLKANLWIAGVAVVFVSLLSGVFSFFKGRLSAMAAEKAACSLRNELYTHIQGLPFSYHVKAETGDLIQRCSSDVDTVRRFLAVQLTAIANSVLMIGVALSLMIPVNGRITLISMALIPLLFSFAWLFFRMVVSAFRSTDVAEGRLSAILQENLSGVRVVRAFGQARAEIAKFDRINNDFMEKSFRLSVLDAAYWATGDFFSMLQTMITLIVCVHEVVAGAITLGDMIVFTSYTGMLLWPVRQLGRILSDAGKSMVALQRIGEVLSIPAEPQEAGALRPPLTGDIVFDHVSFSYEGGPPVLNDISFTARQGQTVALLGATGSGKSTIVHLLQRLHEPTGGEIRIGGVPLSAVDRRYLRQRIGLVLQESFLFSRTIRDNVAIAVRSPGGDDVERAVRDAGAWEFISQSEKGFDTLVGERGVTLSGGQKQRIAIARTLLKDSDILVFDDSLSAVDTRTDARIRHSLQARSTKTTTFIISHRITTLSQADLILVLEQGRIADRGTHDELLRSKGMYARINAIQSGMEDQDGAGTAGRPSLGEETP